MKLRKDARHAEIRRRRLKMTYDSSTTEIPSALTNFLIEKIRQISEFVNAADHSAEASIIAEVNRALFEKENEANMLAFLLKNSELFDSLLGGLLAKLQPSIKYEVCLEALKTLQNLSLVASQGYEMKFKNVIQAVAC